MRNAWGAYAERVCRICGTRGAHMRNSCAAYAPELQRISRTQKLECSSVETCSCCTVLIVCLYSPKRHVTLGFEVTTPPKITDLGHVRNAAPHMRQSSSAYAERVCRICGTGAAHTRNTWGTQLFFRVLAGLDNRNLSICCGWSSWYTFLRVKYVYSSLISIFKNERAKFES